MLIASPLLPLFEFGKPREITAQGKTKRRNFMNDKKDRREVNE